MILTADAMAIVAEYQASLDENDYGEMTWDEINALRGWDCTNEEEVISCLDSDYIDMTEEGCIVFIMNNFRR